MKIIDTVKFLLKQILPYLRKNEDLVFLLSLIGKRFATLQSCLIYLANSYDIRKARGIYLDYIGKEVGTERDEVDYSSFFCVNSPDINDKKYFYFSSSGTDPATPISLEDSEFISKIIAKILSNTAHPNIKNIIAIIKAVTNADDVLVIQEDNACLKIVIKGRKVVTANIGNYIKQMALGNGIYLKEIKVND